MDGLPVADGLYAVRFGPLGHAVPARVLTSQDGRFASILGTGDAVPEGEWRTGRWTPLEATKPAPVVVVGEVAR